MTVTSVLEALIAFDFGSTFKRLESPGKGQNHWWNFTYEPETKKLKTGSAVVGATEWVLITQQTRFAEVAQAKNSWELLMQLQRVPDGIFLSPFVVRLKHENVFGTSRKWFNFVYDCSDMNLSIESVSMRCHMSRRNQHKLTVVCCDSYQRH